MKLGVDKNKKKILVSGYNNSIVIHPMWLRERVTDAKYLDKNNGLRLYLSLIHISEPPRPERI